jgi:hypothetical protein
MEVFQMEGFYDGDEEEMFSSVNTVVNEVLRLKQDTLILLLYHLGH